MPRKDIRQAASNLEDSATYIPDRYKSGVQAADWKSKAASDTAEEKFSSAMQEVISDALRQAGVRDKDNSDWQNPAVEHGAAVIADRIRDAIGDYNSNFGPILDAMNSAAETAPEKTLDPMRNIDERLKPVVQAAIEAAE